MPSVMMDWILEEVLARSCRSCMLMAHTATNSLATMVSLEGVLLRKPSLLNTKPFFCTAGVLTSPSSTIMRSSEMSPAWRMVQPLGQYCLLTLLLTLSLSSLPSSPCRMEEMRGICRSQWLADTAIQLWPSLLLCSSCSACRFDTSSMKFTKESLSGALQILDRSTSPSWQPSSVCRVALPVRKSMSSPMMGMTALKQTTKEAQMKGMAQVKQYICSLVLGVTSPQPMVVAVTISLYRMTQSSGREPSVSPRVKILYPSITSPRQRYSTRVYLRMLTTNLRILVRELLADSKRSSTASPKALKTKMILRKYSPVTKVQLLGKKQQLRLRVSTIWNTSRKCFLLIRMLTVVSASSRKKSSREISGSGVQIWKQTKEMSPMWKSLMYAVRIFSMDSEILIKDKNSMPTLTELIETPQAFNLETVMAENPQFLERFIDLLSVPQNILLCNERECYLYPCRVSEMLSMGMAYRLLIQKREGKEEAVYLYLQRLFANINREEGEPTLLGYCCKVLISLVKKTPEIYEFVKDNQNLLLQILRDDEKMSALKEFLSLFLTQSTMELYVFLKSMVIRNIIFRIVEDENVGPLVYKCIDYFYENVLKGFEEVAEDERPELLEVCKNFEDEHFITLLILKLEAENSHRSYHIGNFLYRIVCRNNEATELVALHVDTLLDFMEEYEESSLFMQQLRPEHVAILKILMELMRLGKLKEELTAQLIKRLLVYSSVHSSNSIVHNLLIKGISYCREQGKEELLSSLNIVSFFAKSETEQSYGFMSLRRRVFAYWIEHHLDGELEQSQKEMISAEYKRRRSAIEGSKYYKDSKINGNDIDFGSTKAPSGLVGMVLP